LLRNLFVVSALQFSKTVPPLLLLAAPDRPRDFYNQPSTKQLPGTVLLARRLVLAFFVEGARCVPPPP
jgi:hypothetical protein